MNRLRTAIAAPHVRLRAVAAAAFVALAAHATMVRADVIDEVTTVRQGESIVVRVTFNVAVQVLQQSPLAESDTYRVRLDLVGASGPSDGVLAAEFRRVQPGGSVPDFTITFAPGGTARGRELTIQLRERRALTVRQGTGPREMDIVFAPVAAEAPSTAPAPVPAPAAVPVLPRPDDAALQAVEQQASELMAQAQRALIARRFDEAVQRLNQLLLLPPNAQSEAAQALIGDAWVGAGDARRARLEYELYLKLHPQGADAARVATQLAAIGGAVARPAPTPGAAAAPAAAPASTRSYAGNIAQYFSSGNTRSRSLVNLPSGIDQTTLSRTTESALITSADLSARFTSQDSEVRAVLRGSGSTNLSSGSHSSSLLSAAYVDYRQLANSLALRVGRQSAISGGLLGMFDGVSLAYPVRPGIKVDLMGGVPANLLVNSPRQRLLGAMVELDGLLDKWGGNVYLVDQTSEGYTNRRALGAELRYADETWSGYALVDYDLEFRALNAVTVQASWQAPAQTTVTLLLDDRKAPSIALVNALISHGAPSLQELIVGRGLSIDQLRIDALGTSARAQQAMVSVSRPLNPQWQLSGDLRYSQVGALPQVGDLFDATPATGAQYTFSMQATGSNLYSTRDINSFNLAMMSTPQFKGAQIAYSNLTGFRDNELTVEPSIRFYAQRDTEGVQVRRVSTGLRGSWRISRRASVLAEGLAEHSTTSGPSTNGNSNAASFYMGYRYELF